MKKGTEQGISHAKDLMSVEDVIISGHALSQFQIRASVPDLIKAAAEIRNRFAESSFILDYPRVKTEPGSEKNPVLYFRDQVDPEIVYAVLPNLRKRGYVMLTVLKPFSEEITS